MYKIYCNNRAWTRKTLIKCVIRMKIIAFLILVMMLQGHAASYGQKVSLNFSKAPLVDILDEIQKQTGYDFLYNSALIDGKKSVTIKIQNTQLDKALFTILSPHHLSFEIDNKSVLIKKSSTSTNKAKESNHLTERYFQQYRIHGIVSNETGQAITGATISVKGTTHKTQTDGSGNYSISLEKGQNTLIFSSVGYETKEIDINGRSEINVSLIAQVGNLDEVVVVGMNMTQQKRAVTGAMSTIQTKELKQSPVANLNNALAGRLPGLITVQATGQPGADAAAMYIRGISTYGSSAPLVVVDGLPRKSGFSQIDPNEVESISILKDASSSALYGIQGANGIVVVTTKRGKADQAPKIDFTFQNGSQQTTRLPKLASTYESALYINDKDVNSGVKARFSNETLEIIKNGTEPFLYPNVNWFDEMLKTSANQAQYNINISGSTNRVRYFVSGSHLNQGSLLKYNDEFFKNYEKNSGYKRYNFRSNIDIDATKDLKVQVDLAGRLEDRTSPASGFESLLSQIGGMSSYTMPIFNPDGSLGSTSNFTGDAFFQNPYGQVTQGGYSEAALNSMYGTISAKHKLDFITKGLSAQAFFSFENENNNTVTRSRKFDAFWYKGLDKDGKPIYQKTQTATTLGTSGSNNIEKSSYLDARIMYETTVNEDHAIGAQVLANRTLRLYNYDLPYAYQGISGRVTYAYKAKMFLEANMGYNGSENFPSDRRYGLFPSVSAGWIVSDEPFMKNISAISYLKLRGSYGEVGNDKIGGQRWLYLTDFVSGGGYAFGVSPVSAPGFNESRIGNPFVTWERSQKSNLGFETTLFNNLLNITIDVFKERRSNILTNPGTVADYLGLGTLLSALNTGVVNNRGIDGEVKIHKNWTSDFSTFLNVQLTYARNKVIENDQPTPAFPYQDLRGQEVGYVLGYKAVGLFQSQEEINNSAVQSFDNKVIPGDIRYLDVNEDGIINEFDRMPIQNHNVPRYVGGLSFGAAYKGLDISFLLNGAKGGTATQFIALNSTIINERWTENNKEQAKIPVAKVSNNNDLLSDFYTIKTDYLKLRNAEIGYILPNNWVNKIGFNYIRVFANGQNLAVWDKLWIKDRDPETSGGAFKYPIQRIFNFGVNVRL